jgi:hypothetical protein
MLLDRNQEDLIRNNQIKPKNKNIMTHLKGEVRIMNTIIERKVIRYLLSKYLRSK